MLPHHCIVHSTYKSEQNREILLCIGKHSFVIGKYSFVIGKYSFVNRSITDWNQLPEGAIGISHGKTHIFKTKFRKVQNSGESEGDKK
jgi:hypothetical protein